MRLSSAFLLSHFNLLVVDAFVSPQWTRCPNVGFEWSEKGKVSDFSRLRAGFVSPVSKRNVHVGLNAAVDIPLTDETANNSGGNASITSSIVNLVKSIVGAGVLSLPAGIAAFGNAPSALIPASVLIALIGGLSGYGFSLIGRVCHYTGSTSYREGENYVLILYNHSSFDPSIQYVSLAIIEPSMGKIDWSRNQYCSCRIMHL